MSSISIYVFLSCHFDIPVIFLQMRFNCRWGLKVIPFLALLLIVLYYFRSPSNTLGVNIQPRQGSRIQKLLIEKSQSIITDYSDIPYKIKENVASHLPQNACVCQAGEETFHLPFSNLLFPRVWAHNLQQAFLEVQSDPESVQQQRAEEYHQFLRRSHTAADMLIIAEADNPLQYPTQGVKVQPLKTIIIPGLGLRLEGRNSYMVNLTATMGTFDVAATVDGVSVKGMGEKHISLLSPALYVLNRQLQFVTYTNTIFHPMTSDLVQFVTEGHESFFTIKVGHRVVPKLYNSGQSKGYNITSLVTIATKTFLRYDKLKDLIASIREFYPTILIIIADDNEHTQPVTGPHIEQYIMPFGKGWFAGRNLAVSQVITKYVLWVDDDFIFTANTKLEKMVDILEKTTLDLVGGAVREFTGYTATYRHTISVEEGGNEGDCLNMRNGFHHAVEGFPNCVVADAVINFFMARTDKVRQVGFDPRLSRTGHLEFFVDALGTMHIGSCSDVIINHASKIKLPWTKTETQKAYEQFRYSSRNTGINHNEIFYFKNRFKCMTSQ
ncbi:beta-1,4 N-acetylgalactosaminyltransferase 1a isoform X1 [Xiphophorus hellerii]|uniref:beta-1,4 N-acetylgalactosaminyltransferase 1a isoform X1 n=1 Tax=Xiphophorus hellerii TaxID=8084 RepID=UPI0013B3B1BA|nr:beta-1,4 N-acetylgalactosaminyltransferase 1-like isoform X1 [Xiphophorus hellerii]